MEFSRAKRVFASFAMLATVSITGFSVSSTPAVAASLPTCNVHHFDVASSLSTRPGGTTVRMVLTSHYFPSCDWSYDTKYQFFTSSHSAIGSALDFQSSPTVAVPVTPWPVDDTFQVVQALTTEEGVQCTQKSASYVGVTVAKGVRLYVALAKTVGVCVGGNDKWTSLQSISFPKPSSCTSSSLKISVGQSNGAAGTIYYPIIFANVGPKACVISGIPSVQPTSNVVVGSAHVGVGPVAATSDLSASGVGDPVRLSPGAKASANFGVTETGNYTPSTCVAASFKGINVSLTGTGNWWTAHAGTTCTLLASTTITGVVPGVFGLAP